MHPLGKMAKIPQKRRNSHLKPTGKEVASRKKRKKLSKKSLHSNITAETGGKSV